MCSPLGLFVVIKMEGILEGLPARRFFSVHNCLLPFVVLPECLAARRVRKSVFAVVVPLHNDRSPTETFGDDEGRTYLPNPRG